MNVFTLFTVYMCPERVQGDIQMPERIQDMALFLHVLTGFPGARPKQCLARPKKWIF
jgi:hypothetical protein